jgi:hypothetical protein
MKENEDQNLIELLRQALLFYADERNYEPPKHDSSVCVTSSQNMKPMIEVDNGSQARFALTKIREFNEASEKLEADYMKSMNEAIEKGESPENVLKIIEGFKNIAKGD